MSVKMLHMILTMAWMTLSVSFVRHNVHPQRHLFSSPSFGGYTSPETKEGAFEIAKSCSINLPCIILVNPFLDANVGSVSRAMLNFGLTELRIVDPNCDIRSENALALAAGSRAVLENAKIYPTLEAATSDLQRILATTVRPRHMTQIIYTPMAAAEIAVSSTNFTRCGIVFGRERSGLTNDEVALADGIISIPSFKHFSSLNLAQAVNIVGYELWKRCLDIEATIPPAVWLHTRDDGERIAKREELDFFFGRLEANLDKNDYQPEPGRRQLCYRSIRNIFQRVLMTKQEVDLLQGVLTALVKKS